MAVLAQAQITVSRIVDISSVTRYYMLQSSTASAPSKPTANPPGGNWVTTEPTYTTGSTNTLYFVDLTVFTNSTFSYSAVSKSSSYEAAKAAYNKAVNAENTASNAQDDIDNLEVGGRNLLLKSDFILSRDNTAATTSQTTITVNESHYSNIVGKELTLSCYVHSLGDRDTSLDSSTTLNNRFGAHGLLEWEDSTGTNTTKKTVYPFTNLLNQTIDNNRISDTYAVTPPSGYDTLTKVQVSVQMYAKPSSTNTEVWLIGHPKLEFGNHATDWTPAPEDISSAIDKSQETADTNAAEIEETKKQIALLQDSIASLVTDADGFSLMTQTENGWAFNMGSVNSALASAQESLVTLSGTVDDANSLIGQLQTAVDSIESKTAYVNIGTDTDGTPYIDLGQNGNNFKVRITNTAINFLDGETKVAWINNKSLYITTATIRGDLDIQKEENGAVTSTFTWGYRGNGNFGLQYKGGGE